MSNENCSAALQFWEHPDMTQIMELVCLMCPNVDYIARKKHQAYPYMHPCTKCKGPAMPTQEKRDWLKTLHYQAKALDESDSSPGKPSPKTGSGSS